MYVYIFTCNLIYKYTCACACVCIYRTYTQTHIYMTYEFAVDSCPRPLYPPTPPNKQANVHIFTHTNGHIQYMSHFHTYTRIYANTLPHTLSLFLSLTHKTYIYEYTFTYIHARTHAHKHTHTYINMHEHT